MGFAPLPGKGGTPPPPSVGGRSGFRFHYTIGGLDPLGRTTMKFRVSTKTRNSVASLSSGVYYQHPSHWWNRLTAILESEGLTPSFAMPVFYSEDGRATMVLETLSGEGVDNTVLCFSWHRMASYNWEIVCYLS